MGTISSILVSVGNFSARSLPAVTKAAQLAKALDATIELFHDLDTPITIETLGRPGYALKDIKAEARRAAIEGLERLAAPLRARGLTVSTAAAWDYPPCEAIVRRAVAMGVGLIVAPRRNRHRLPAFMGYTDWELLRLSPIPVLLVKTLTPYRRPVVLAAIDPTHAHSKPTALDGKILDYGAQVSKALRGALHVMYGYRPEPLPPSVTFDTHLRNRLKADSERRPRQVFDGALVGRSIPASRRYLVRGDPTVMIPATVHKTRSAIVVIGAVARSPLKRLFIGSTAESVMDKLRCDLLVVKPVNSALHVSRARHGPRFISTTIPA